MTTSTIQESLKKYFYSGVGLAAHSSEILQSTVNDFVSKGKLNEADGKKIVSEAIKKMEARYNEAVHKLGTYSANEVSMLKKKIESLEKQVSTKEKKAAAKAGSVIKKVTGTKKPSVAKAVKAVKKAATKKNVVSKAKKAVKAIEKKVA